MKPQYKIHTPYSFLTAVLGLVLVSCATNLTYQEAMDKNERNIEDSGALADARFLVNAKSFNLLEMRLTEAAVTSGYASSVVDMSRTFLEAHRQMNEDINDLGRREKIALPTDMNETHEQILARIRNTDRENFDREFLMTLKRINDENKVEYLRMATEAQDADIRSFAARKLDMLRDHETRMENVEKELMSTY